MLMLPPFSFAHCTDTCTGTPATPHTGVMFDIGASNTDLTPVSIFGSAVAHDVHYMIIAVGNAGVRQQFAPILADLLFDPAGGASWTPLIENLTMGQSVIFSSGGTFNTPVGHNVYYCFPLWVKSGAKFAIQGKTNYFSDITQARISLWLFGEPSRADMWWCGQKVETLGTNDSVSGATTVAPGSSGTWGSWTNVGSTTSGRYGAIQLGFNGSNGTMTGSGYFWQIGAGGSQLPGTPTFYNINSSGEEIYRLALGPIWCDVPQGAQLQVRGTGGAAAESCTVALYGVY